MKLLRIRRWAMYGEKISIYHINYLSPEALHRFNSHAEPKVWKLAHLTPLSPINDALGMDLEKSYNAWFLKYNSVLDKHAPLRKKRVRQKEAPWINVDILNKIHERDDMKKKANTSKSEDDWKSYKKLRNAVTDMIRKAKRLYVSENISSNKGNSTAMWTTLRRILPRKVNVSSIQKLTVKWRGNHRIKNHCIMSEQPFCRFSCQTEKNQRNLVITWNNTWLRSNQFWF